MTHPWHVLTANVPDALDDEVAAVLGSGSLGVEVAAKGPGLSEVRVYLDAAEDLHEWRRRAAAVLSAHGVNEKDAGLAVVPVEDGLWVARWQASLAPIPLGERFVVLPTGREVPAGGREPIRLIPGMAFGTGEHATTRLSAAAVERAVAAGSRWLDLGTGTGLLAIIAARCGAARVLAVDIDANAADVASEVVARNGAGGIVEVRAGSIEARGAETFNGIMANIQSSFFMARAASLAEALAPGGLLVASGFLDEDLAEVGAALAAHGIDIESREAEGPWMCVLARRRQL